jgi:hypothetical protein
VGLGDGGQPPGDGRRLGHAGEVGEIEGEGLGGAAAGELDTATYEQRLLDLVTRGRPEAPSIRQTRRGDAGDRYDAHS